MRKFCFSVLLFFCSYAFAQETPIGFRNEAIYDFLDEMANEGFISLNSAVKPYSVRLVAQKLFEAKKSSEKMNRRQQNELDFYLRQYGLFTDEPNNSYAIDRKGDVINIPPRFNFGFYPPGLHYKDSMFQFTLRPIWGVREYIGGAENIMHTWGGVEAFGSIGGLTMYASLRDNHIDEMLSSPTYLTQAEAGNYKVNVQGNGGVDYSEMRGGVIYGWKWGSFGLVKDQVQWGTNYHGASIFSGRNPSYAMIKLQVKPVKWFELNYIHGWLVSEVVDSSRSYMKPDGIMRKVFIDKYIAANMMTFTPFRGVDVSVGNSIIYSDTDVQPAYLIPIMFYKSIDHTLNHGVENQNSQMFADVSIRRIKNLHLYGTMFCDEFSMSRVGDPDRHNFMSWKGGFKLSNWPVRNVAITAEYTRVNPIVYKHRVSTTTFETNKVNLGYYLRDNSQEMYLAAEFKPIRGLMIRAEFFEAKHGNEYDYLEEYDGGVKVDELPFMQDVTWKNTTFTLSARWEFVHDWWLYADFTHSNIVGYDVDGQTAQYYLNLYTPKSFQGKNDIITLGLNLGF